MNAGLPPISTCNPSSDVGARLLLKSSAVQVRHGSGGNGLAVAPGKYFAPPKPQPRISAQEPGDTVDDAPNAEFVITARMIGGVAPVLLQIHVSFVGAWNPPGHGMPLPPNRTIWERAES